MIGLWVVPPTRARWAQIPSGSPKRESMPIVSDEGHVSSTLRRAMASYFSKPERSQRHRTGRAPNSTGKRKSLEGPLSSDDLAKDKAEGSSMQAGQSPTDKVIPKSGVHSGAVVPWFRAEGARSFAGGALRSAGANSSGIEQSNSYPSVDTADQGQVPGVQLQLTSGDRDATDKLRTQQSSTDRFPATSLSQTPLRNTNPHKSSVVSLGSPGAQPARPSAPSAETSSHDGKSSSSTNSEQGGPKKGGAIPNGIGPLLFALLATVPSLFLDMASLVDSTRSATGLLLSLLGIDSLFHLGVIIFLAVTYAQSRPVSPPKLESTGKEQSKVSSVPAGRGCKEPQESISSANPSQDSSPLAAAAAAAGLPANTPRFATLLGLRAQGGFVGEAWKLCLFDVLLPVALVVFLHRFQADVLAEHWKTVVIVLWPYLLVSIISPLVTLLVEPSIQWCGPMLRILYHGYKVLQLSRARELCAALLAPPSLFVGIKILIVWSVFSVTSESLIVLASEGRFL